MKTQQFKQLLKRYLDESASKAERYIVDIWYHSFDRDHSGIVPGIENSSIEYETGQRILSKIQTSNHRKGWYSWQTLRVACSILLISTVSLFFLLKPKDHSGQTAVIFKTLPGQTKKILLRDSSVVWLNANSTLEIAASYSEKNRSVKLSGEAYFEVTHDPQKPFFVAAGPLTTKVLGTTFNVRAYPASRFSKITLLTGKVWVTVKAPGKRTGGVILTPNQTLQYDLLSHHAKTQNKESSIDQKAWTTGKLIFDDTSMDEVKEILKESYGLNMQVISKKLNSRRISGEFRLDDQPEYIIKTLCKLIHAKYTINGKTIYIQSK
ncbi:FecR family protein [Pedobacter metabolipauper]|uniref:FecR family protein n=1 Tax=Pedobacter metabolipauper TaxID=425513 RepID=A0A4R6SW98_9SPHI|nr:FecR domain-containing protein [Pedobacter metabolipauper]TDQ08651.1 FecR family protein [Pedobacter metabolipauper]